MTSFFTNSFNLLYNKITNLFTTEEKTLKNILTTFFADYDDIIQDNKIVFILHIQKLENVCEESYNEAFCHSKILINDNTNNTKIKKNIYKYKYTFSPENYKQEKKLFYVNIFIPYDLNYNCIIYKKYNYKIYLIQNNNYTLIKDGKSNIKDYTDITLKSVITEIIDFITIY